VNRFVSMTALSAAVAAVGLVGASGALSGTVSKTVKLDEGAAKSTVTLPSISTQTVYTISVTGPNAVKINLDLRSKAGSVKYPGIFTSTAGSKRLRIYTYRPLDAGKYVVVVAKAKGPAATVSLKVTSAPAKAAKPAKTTKSTKSA